jgi:hypothetical protein
MPNEFQYDVFLSHSGKDKAVVRPLAERLRKDGLKMWFDEWVLKPGDSIPAKIEEGLEQSRVLALCMSANAFGSDWAQLEAGTFRFRDPLNKERRFIPLRLDDAPIKGSLAQFLYINWRPEVREQEYAKLLEACQHGKIPKLDSWTVDTGWRVASAKEVVPDRKARDDFKGKTKDTLARRVGMRCSNPSCQIPTSGPHSDPNKAISVGVAAHIAAAAAGGPRFDTKMSQPERTSINNGIWLCQNCAKLVDNDETRFAESLLRQWKTAAEQLALQRIETSRLAKEAGVVAVEPMLAKLQVGFDCELYLRELDRLFADSRIAEWYVSLAGYQEGHNDIPVDVNAESYVDSWLQGKDKGRLAVLGDYGTGKSWLSLRAAKRLADKHRNAAAGGPVPLLISFKRYQANMNLVELIRAELLDGYGVHVLNPLELRRGLQTGCLLPILDGLDEMAKALGERTALVAYSRLDPASEVPKVLVTCRTHYFQSGSEQRELFSPDAVFRALVKLPRFDILHLKLLDKPRIRECITRRFDPTKAGEVVRFVESTYNLPELCSRPVLLALVCESHDQLPQLANASSSAGLYEIYIDCWLHREFRDGRLAVEPDAVKQFFEDLAKRMVDESTLVIDGTRLKQQLTAFLENLGLAPHKWKELDRQLITSTFVRRSVDDGWQFAHRSFQEFFYARKFFRWEIETSGKGQFPVTYTPIWQFIAQMALEKWNREKALFWIQERVERQNDHTLTMTTLRAAAGYWLLKKDPGKARDHIFSGIMLDSVDLTSLDLARCDLSRVDFHGSDLAGTDLRLVDFSDSFLAGAQFLGADLRNTKFERSDIAYADFRGSNFGVPNSSVWTNTITQFRDCEGLAFASFDQEVSSFLAESIDAAAQRRQ